MKKYFTYELKKNAYAIGAITLVMIIFYVAPILMENPSDVNVRFNINLLSVCIGIVAVIVPMWLMRYKMKKSSVDLYYALPLSHTKILAARFLLGLIAVFVPYTLAYWLGALATIAKINNYISAVWYVPFYFATIIPVYIIYSISSFVYTRANKGIDGFMFLLFWCFALMLSVYAVGELANINNHRYYMDFLPFDPLISVTQFFQSKIDNKYSIQDGIDASMLVGYIITTLMSAGATFGLLWTERNAKAENVGQISESWFGYKIMLPLYTVGLTSICPLDSYLSLFIIILIATAMFFASVLYKRTIKIGQKQTIVLSVAFLVGLILSIINNYA